MSDAGESGPPSYVNVSHHAPASFASQSSIPISSLFSALETRRIKIEDSHKKQVSAECVIDGKSGVLLLEKASFGTQLQHVAGLLRQEEDKLSVQELLTNDIYHNLLLEVPGYPFTGIKATLTYPSEPTTSEPHGADSFLVNETPVMYDNVTLPDLTKQPETIQWVKHSLRLKDKPERIAFEDPDPKIGFTLLPDLKWDGIQNSKLHLIAIVHLESIQTLRDLTAEHLPLLENVKEKGTKAIWDKYGLSSHQLRIYLYYPPTYCHFHVHFTYLNFSPSRVNTEKAHLLETVINNIKLIPDYYQQSSIPVVVHKGTTLYQSYLKAGYNFQDGSNDSPDGNQT